VTAITNLDTQVPHSLNTATSHIILNWDFLRDPRARASRATTSWSRLRPVNQVAPAPGAASLALGALGLWAMRRRRR